MGPAHRSNCAGDAWLGPISKTTPPHLQQIVNFPSQSVVTLARTAMLEPQMGVPGQIFILKLHGLPPSWWTVANDQSSSSEPRVHARRPRSLGQVWPTKT